MTLNLKQWLAIVVAVLSAMAAATTQMTEIFGPTLAKSLMAGAGLLNTILSSILAIVSSQTGLLKDVQAMEGVDKIVVNKDASPALATLAVDPRQDKIESKLADVAAVSATAKANE